MKQGFSVLHTQPVIKGFYSMLTTLGRKRLRGFRINWNLKIVRIISKRIIQSSEPFPDSQNTFSVCLFSKNSSPPPYFMWSFRLDNVFENFPTITGVVSHSSASSNHSPSNRERAMASFVAGTIISFFRLLVSIFSGIFRALASFA